MQSTQSVSSWLVSCFSQYLQGYAHTHAKMRHKPQQFPSHSMSVDLPPGASQVNHQIITARLLVQTSGLRDQSHCQGVGCEVTPPPQNQGFELTPWSGRYKHGGCVYQRGSMQGKVHTPLQVCSYSGCQHRAGLSGTLATGRGSVCMERMQWSH